MSPLQLYCIQGGVSPQGGGSVCSWFRSYLTPPAPQGGAQEISLQQPFSSCLSLFLICRICIQYGQVPREGGVQSPSPQGGYRRSQSPRGGADHPRVPAKGKNIPVIGIFCVKISTGVIFRPQGGGCQPPKSPGGVAGTVPGPCVVNINI